MSGLARALLDGVTAALRGDAGVQALAGERVYGSPFAGAVFPYVAVGPWKAKAWSTGEAAGAEVSFALHCVSRKGRDEAMALSEAVCWVLDAEPVTLTGARLVGLFFVDADAVQAKGDVWRATARFRALVEAV